MSARAPADGLRLSMQRSVRPHLMSIPGRCSSLWRAGRRPWLRRWRQTKIPANWASGRWRRGSRAGTMWSWESRPADAPRSPSPPSSMRGAKARKRFPSLAIATRPLQRAAQLAHRDRSGAGGDLGIDSHESRHGAEDGAEHALQRSHDPAGIRLWQPDGERHATEFEAGGARREHSAAGGGRGCGDCRQGFAGRRETACRWRWSCCRRKWTGGKRSGR